MKFSNIWVTGAILLGISTVPAYAVDTWSTTKGVLNIPLVQYTDSNGTKTYQNVTAVLGGVISVGQSICSPASTAADTFSSSTGQLTIPAVTVIKSTGSANYCNVQVWLQSITSVGGICADAASCSKYFTPVQFASTMPRSYSPTLTLLSGSFTNRARYLISDSATVSSSANYLTIGNVYNTIVPSGFEVTSGIIPKSSTHDTYLSKLIQVVAVNDDGTTADVYYTDAKPNAIGYRLDSHLHPNESIDVDTADGNKLKFKRNIGVPVGTAFTSTTTAMTPLVTTDGFIAFSYDSGSKLLQAKKRYTRTVVQDVSAACTKSPCFNAVFTVDATFNLANYYVSYNAGVYSLVASSAAATPLYFYGSADGYTVPASMNPTLTAYSTANPAAAFPTAATALNAQNLIAYTLSTVSKTETNFASLLYTKYQPQVSVNGVTTPGANESTKAAADAFLQTLKTQVESNTACAITPAPGAAPEDLPAAALRYSPTVYTAFRDALLSGALVSDAVADGAPNQRLVPFVYFTNEQDTATGCYHPFMVIVTYTQTGGPHGLQDIPVPPAAGMSGTGAGMTRLANLVGQTIRIPMRMYGNVNTSNFTTVNSAVTGFTTNLCTDIAAKCSAAKADTFNWASSNDNGISYDGAQIFPIMNASLLPSSWKAELSAYGCHVGQGGGGAHCHADGFVSGQDNRLTLYNDIDYVGRTHPPLIGFGYDGIALFGQYRPQDSTMLGAGVTLDAFGGHDHDGIGYHYHARVVDMPASPYLYIWTDNNKTICSALDSKCISGQTYQGTSGISTPTKVSVLVQGAWKGNIRVVPFFRTGSKIYAGQN